MKMTFHNLKVAVRNLMKYKLQTIISVLSIAIGIVTLVFAHAAMSRLKLPLPIISFLLCFTNHFWRGLSP